ncbi:hypothetical protein BACSTE_01193 [Bacteroides stercoris ATCC 43183]|uniref:Uncharacterized protein n=2 Tax=Bacteroides stercoris TaxID=46506 RepID=A0A413ZPC7_BACSE|nr:hypothetical protein [Bacteroides sp.]EDS15754.1 hypothetical protein BACSTE_01193 [Bacteroides stercoris ATCC 43183]RGR16000.1 hypothetical protein DWY65_04275 [Bacteroides stercoris]MDR3880971.1 hypothetical protein [Bacteroides sp.]RGR35106.1 hypothetical protein DWY52_10175 [Bacteroides stercoris]RGW32134.1 hypothetical protein DWV77_14815 [Bacteroides stercoris]
MQDGRPQDVPRRGTLRTNGWYSLYHALVLSVPTVGILHTNYWYFPYRPMVLPVPPAETLFPYMQL